MAVSVIGVVGAGFMGSGIAESAAAAGKHVIVYEPDDRPFQRSRESLATSVGRAVSRGKLDREEGERLVERVLYTTRFEDLGGADAVVEAITEDVHVKSKVFARLGEELPDLQFLASNTSSIPIAELARPHPAPGASTRASLLLAGAGDEAGRGGDRDRHRSRDDRGGRVVRRLTSASTRSGPRTGRASS